MNISPCSACRCLADIRVLWHTYTSLMLHIVHSLFETYVGVECGPFLYLSASFKKPAHSIQTNRSNLIKSNPINPIESYNIENQSIKSRRIHRRIEYPSNPKSIHYHCEINHNEEESINQSINHYKYHISNFQYRLVFLCLFIKHTHKSSAEKQQDSNNRRFESRTVRAPSTE